MGSNEQVPGGSKPRLQLLVCDGPSCGLTYESDRLKARMLEQIAAHPELAGRVTVVDFNCFGRCGEGPNMFVRVLTATDDPTGEPDFDVLEQQRGFYPGMDEARCDRVLEEHCLKGHVVEDMVDDY
ncbi:MAG: (2Fe-2S) ferredoxin domain-containing protein [Myxococcales bacterium]|nr:(2Fe-2S) ferredoxin domain-containing protein [Myxococcales bacterium]